MNLIGFVPLPPSFLTHRVSIEICWLILFFPLFSINSEFISCHFGLVRVKKNTLHFCYSESLCVFFLLMRLWIAFLWTLYNIIAIKKNPATRKTPKKAFYRNFIILNVKKSKKYFCLDSLLLLLLLVFFFAHRITKLLVRNIFRLNSIQSDRQCETSDNKQNWKWERLCKIRCSMNFSLSFVVRSLLLLLFFLSQFCDCVRFSFSFFFTETKRIVLQWAASWIRALKKLLTFMIVFVSRHFSSV